MNALSSGQVLELFLAVAKVEQMLGSLLNTGDLTRGCDAASCGGYNNHTFMSGGDMASAHESSSKTCFNVFGSHGGSGHTA